MILDEQKILQHTIISYTKQKVVLRDKSLIMPCFIAYNYAEQVTNDLDKELKKIINYKIELLIIGTKLTIDFKKQVMIKNLINCDIMGSRAAIGSFNLLLTDYRKVGVLLL